MKKGPKEEKNGKNWGNEKKLGEKIGKIYEHRIKVH